MVVSRDVGHARFSTMGCCWTPCSSLSHNFIRFPIISHKRPLRSRTQAAVSALRSRTQAPVSAICMRDFSLRGKLRRAPRVLCRASKRHHDLCQASTRHPHHYHIIHHQIILHIFVLWSHCASSTYIHPAFYDMATTIVVGCLLAFMVYNLPPYVNVMRVYLWLNSLLRGSGASYIL